MSKRFISVAIATIVFVSWGATAALSPAAAMSSLDAQFVSAHNNIRSQYGRPTLPVYSDLASVALRHSQDMAAQQNLYHNPNLANEVQGWTVLGENVGYGGSVSDLMNAFMNSPEHRSNILDTDYNQFGIGAVTDSSGTIWVTVVFAHRGGSSSPPPSYSHHSSSSGSSHRGNHNRRHDAVSAASSPLAALDVPGLTSDVQTVAMLLKLDSNS
ncbi:MAG: CAP domain-containing protein [Actinomycetota bacterium]